MPSASDAIGRLLLGFIVCAVGSCACEKKIEQQRDDLVGTPQQLLRDLEAVAEITTSDVCLVQAELSAAKIESWIVGSKVYVVSVRRTSAEAAREVLRKSERLRESQVKVIDARGKTAP